MESNGKSNKNELEQYEQAVRRRDDDIESNVSYGSNDEDPILTATITFDVTVDPNGQVISTTEGQIISEGIQKHSDGTRGVLQHNPLPVSAAGIQADSLTSMNSVRQSKDLNTVLQDSLDEPESDSDDSTSTSTESLIERSKKYMNQEAGIIILKRDTPVSKNFNINLDFDLSNTNLPEDSSTKSVLHTVQSDEDASKNFNINLDFDIKNSNLQQSESLGANSEKAFNINLDFDINNSAQKRMGPSSSRKTGVDIDLMITSSATTSKVEEKISNETFEDIKSILKEKMPANIEYWRSVNRDASNDKPFDPSIIERDISWDNVNRADSTQGYTQGPEGRNK